MKYIHKVVNQSLEQLYCKTQTLYLPTKQLSVSSFLQPLAATILLSISMNLTIPGIAYKSNHTVCVFSWLAFYLAQCFQDLSMSLHVSEFSSLKGWIILPCMYVPYFVYPFICWWILGFLQLFDLWIMLLCTWMCKYFFETLPAFSSLGNVWAVT